jgi:hypothetical protein
MRSFSIVDVCALVCFEFRKIKHCHCLQVCRYFHEGYDCIPFFKHGHCPKRGHCGYNHRPYLIDLLKQKEQQRLQYVSSEQNELKTKNEEVPSYNPSTMDEKKTKSPEQIPELSGIDEDVISLPSDTELEEGLQEDKSRKSFLSVQSRPLSGSESQRPTEDDSIRKYPTKPSTSFPGKVPYYRSAPYYRSRSPRKEGYVHRFRSDSYTTDHELMDMKRDLFYPWSVTRDRDGRIYFYNEDTRETTWEHPARRSYYNNMDRRRRSPSEVSYHRPFYR